MRSVMVDVFENPDSSAPIDDAIAAAIGSEHPARISEVVTLLETLADQLNCVEGRPRPDSPTP